MDWPLIISHNTSALRRIVAALVAMALPDCPTLPRRLHRSILRLVRPAEAAARRLVILVARDIVVTPPRAAKPPQKHKTSPAILRGRTGTGIVMPRGATQPTAAPRAGKTLPLLDPMARPFRRRSGFRGPGRSGVPRISAPGWNRPTPVKPWTKPGPFDPLDATRLRQRLAASAAALDDLPGHARRFARWTARRDRARAAGRRRRVFPLRPGYAWGKRRPHSRRRAHEIDEVLGDLHYFALETLEPRDTS
jgi:hypothetical protein